MWMFVIISEVFIKTALNWEEVRTLRAEGILPLVAFFSGFDCDLQGIYILLIPLGLCVAGVFQTWKTVGSNIISRWLQVEDRWDVGRVEA